MLLKIGELAKRTGLTTRMLRHYDVIGLLTPSVRSETGYRLYNRFDIAQLHRIQALRRLNLSLAEVGELLRGEGADLKAVIDQQISALDQQALQVVELRDRLKKLRMSVTEEREPNLDEWLTTLERMAMFGKYFSEENIENHRPYPEPNILPDRRWVDLVADVREHMDQRTPVDDPDVKTLAQRWIALVDETMGDDPRLFQNLDLMHRREEGLQILSGVDGEMLDYMAHAGLEWRFDLYAKYIEASTVEAARKAYRKHLDRWRELLADVYAHMSKQMARGSEEENTLLDRWQALFEECWGKDPDMGMRVVAVYQQEPEIMRASGFSEEMLVYLTEGFTRRNSGLN